MVMAFKLYVLYTRISKPLDEVVSATSKSEWLMVLLAF